jgi:hypothetical protein
MLNGRLSKLESAEKTATFTIQKPHRDVGTICWQGCMLGCATGLFIDTTEVAWEFGVRLTSLNEYVQNVLASTTVP